MPQWDIACWSLWHCYSLMFITWEFILDFHWSRAVHYYSTHAQMTSSNNVMHSSKMFSQVFASFIYTFLLYKTKTFNAVCFFTVIDYRRRHCVRSFKNRKSRYSTSSHDLLFCFSYAMTSSAIRYSSYSTGASKNEIYSLNKPAIIVCRSR